MFHQHAFVILLWGILMSPIIGLYEIGCMKCFFLMLNTYYIMTSFLFMLYNLLILMSMIAATGAGLPAYGSRLHRHTNILWYP